MEEQSNVGKVLALPCLCPHCGASLEVGAEIQLDGVRPLQHTRARWKIEDEKAKEALEAAAAGGLLEPFSKAATDVQKRAHNAPPKAMAKLLLQFIRGAKRVSVPTELVMELAKQQPGDISVIQHCGIAAAVNRGKIFQFFAWDRVQTRGLAALSAVHWVRSKNGYVPASCRVFSDALRQKAAGAFDTAGRIANAV